jgi:transcriptional regulator with XRE-family HTH domain
MEKYIVYPGVIEALKELRGLSYVEMAEQTDIGKDTISRIRQEKPVPKKSFLELAGCLDVPVECLGRPTLLSREDPNLYTSIGLYAELGKGESDEVPFQDFQPHTGRLNNPISYLWASSEGGEISARSLPDDDTDRLLRIRFHNTDQFPGNVAIHPTCLTARQKPDRQIYLTFLARMPDQEEPRLDNAGPVGDGQISLSVRISDAQLQQWEYRDSVSYLLPPVAGSDWNTFVVDLEFNAVRPHWKKFGTGVSFPGERPDFSVITGIVIEVGRGKPGERPGQGDGVVDIMRIHLTADRDFLKDAAQAKNSREGEAAE